MRRVGIVGALVLALGLPSSAVALVPRPQMRTFAETPGDAGAFVDAIGVNVHLTYARSAYVTHYPQVRALLRKSGIRHIRAALVKAPSEAYLDRLEELAGDGVRTDLLTTIGQKPETIRAYATRIPAAIESFEGPNEVDVNAQRGVDWAQRLGTFQRLLYTTVHETAATARVPVVGPSLTSESAFRAVGDLSAFADRGNVHDYYAGRNPGTRGWGGTTALGTYGALSYNLALARIVFGERPVVSTETGYGTDPLRGGVPAPIAVRYLLRLLFEHWNAGITRTYLYELADDGHDAFASNGLLDGEARPKPTYVALSKLIALLWADPGTQPLAPFRYALSADAAVRHSLLEKPDGDVLLALWVEAPGWDPDRGTMIEVPSRPVTLLVPEHGARVVQSVFEDDGAVTVTPRVPEPDGSLTIALTDHLTILDLGRHRDAHR